MGTDYSIYAIDKINSKWVVVFRKDIGEKNEKGYPVTCYEVSPECGKVFEESKIWEQ